MPAGPRSTRRAVAATTSLQEARIAADVAAVSEPAAGRGAGSADPLLNELRRGGLLPLLVLHLVQAKPSYGNQLIEGIADLTAGALAVNPNTMYPLLRSLEARGLIQGEWEHPERRSRRFYRITKAGADERTSLMEEILPRLDRLAEGIEEIRRRVFS